MRDVVFALFILAILQVVQPEATTKDNMLILDSDLLKFENVATQETYRFSYETKDNQLREEVGVLLNPGTPDEQFVVMGKYSYVTPDDTVHTVIYMADKDGYKPQVMMVRKQKAISSSKLKLSLVG